MRPVLHSCIRSCIAVALVASTAGAQKPAQKPTPKQQGGAAVSWKSLKGDWVGQSMRGHTDSVLTHFTLRFTGDKTIRLIFPDRRPVVANLITMGGDSVVVETVKYESVTRKGHMTSVRMVGHVANHKMTGTFHGIFDDGKTIDGTSTAAHKMK